MVKLLANTAAQTLRLTLNEARLVLDDTYTNYLVTLTHTSANEVYAFVANVTDESDRVTTIGISTATNAPTSGNVLINMTGQFIYKVYGQNSSTNLDPDNVAVVGLCETGVLWVTDSTDYWTEDTAETPEDIVPNQ